MSCAKQHSIAVIALLAITLVTTVSPVRSQLANSSWPSFHNHMENDGLSTFIGPDTDTLKWAFKTGSSIFSSPVIGASGTIYVGSYDHFLYAVNPDGTLKWKYESEGPIDGTPAIGLDETIYFTSRDGHLYALKSDGSFNWKYQAQGTLMFSHINIDETGTIYFGTSSDTEVAGFLYALNPDGSLKWKHEGLGGIFYSAAIGDDGTIYSGSIFGNLYALDPLIDDPEEHVKWGVSIADSRNAGTPVIGPEGKIYIYFRKTGYDSQIGTTYIEYHLCQLAADGTGSCPVNVRYFIYGSENRYMYAAPTVADDGTIYMAGAANSLSAFVQQEGRIISKWSYETDNKIYSTPAIDGNGTIYLGSTDGFLHVINPDGSLNWKYQTNGALWSSPAIGSNGTIYIGSVDGNLYAFGYPEKLEPVVLRNPAHNADSISVNPSLHWSTCALATHYQLQLAMEDTFDDLILDTTVIADTVITILDRLEYNTRYFWRVRAINNGGSSDWSIPCCFTTQMTTGLDDDPLPKVFALEQNYPNPFNPTTTIRFSLAQPTRVTLSVYNASGQLVQTLLRNEQRGAGRYELQFNAGSLPSGLYIYRLDAGIFSRSRKMLLIK